MTREEAIKLLLYMSISYVPTDQYGDLDDPQPYEEAIDMAIEALQAKTDGDLISRQDALKPFCVAPDGTRIPEVDCDNFPIEFSVEFIKKHLLSLPSADTSTMSEKHQLSEETSTNTSTDLISREDAIDAVRFKIIPYRHYHKGERLLLLSKHEVLDVINALQSADAVSREEHERLCQKCHVLSERADMYAEKYDELKMARADRPKGEWINKGNYAECSICGAHSGIQFDGVEPIPLKTKFCHNCGAEMKIPLYMYASWDRSKE